MKLPEWVSKVEVWSNTVFFIGDGKMENFRYRGRYKKPKYQPLIAVLKPILAWAIPPEDREDDSCALVTFTPEEFEKITEGVDCEMPRE